MSQDIIDLVNSYQPQHGTTTDQLRRLIHTESRFNPMAVNPNPKSTARGLGQLTKAARIDTGLADEDMFKPDKNLAATDQYFGMMLKQFGNEKDAFGAYHLGAQGYRNYLAGDKTQEAALLDYWKKTMGENTKMTSSDADEQRKLGQATPAELTNSLGPGSAQQMLEAISANKKALTIPKFSPQTGGVSPLDQPPPAAPAPAAVEEQSRMSKIGDVLTALGTNMAQIQKDEYLKAASTPMSAAAPYGLTSAQAQSYSDSIDKANATNAGIGLEQQKLDADKQAQQAQLDSQEKQLGLEERRVGVAEAQEKRLASEPTPQQNAEYTAELNAIQQDRDSLNRMQEDITKIQLEADPEKRLAELNLKTAELGESKARAAYYTAQAEIAGVSDIETEKEKAQRELAEARLNDVRWSAHKELVDSAAGSSVIAAAGHNSNVYMTDSLGAATDKIRPELASDVEVIKRATMIAQTILRYANGQLTDSELNRAGLSQGLKKLAMVEKEVAKLRSAGDDIGADALELSVLAETEEYQKYFNDAQSASQRIRNYKGVQ